MCRYSSSVDANKAMQQLDQMDIAGQRITVKIAPLTPGETAQLAAAAARVDLDDEGAGLHCPLSPCHGIKSHCCMLLPPYNRPRKQSSLR